MNTSSQIDDSLQYLEVTFAEEILQEMLKVGENLAQSSGQVMFIDNTVYTSMTTLHAEAVKCKFHRQLTDI